MANWNGWVLTTKGRALQAKVEIGTELEITKMKLGSGLLSEGETLEDLTDLVKPEQILGIAAKEVMKNEEGEYTGLCKISSTISNAGLTKGYEVRELGVFAQDPDEGEILYAVTTDSAPDYLPPEGGATVISQEFSVYIAISNADHITAEIDPGALATMRYVGIQIDEHNNRDDAHESAFTAKFKAHNADTDAHKDFVGATAEKAGVRGMVPAPPAGAQNMALMGDGTYAYASINLLQRNKAYVVGDIAYSPNLPSWARLECITAGTTGTEEPEFDNKQAGQYITDGTVVFIIDDVRDGFRVGDIVFRPILHDGFIKANGATANRADYPRLVKFATDNNLWTDNPAAEPWKYGNGDGSTTMVLPDYRNRVVQGGDMPAALAAGLPGIVGNVGTPFKLFNKSSGAFYTKSTNDHRFAEAESGGSYSDLLFDASRSNSIYGASDTVQPPAIVLIPQIKY